MILPPPDEGNKPQPVRIPVRTPPEPEEWLWIAADDLPLDILLPRLRGVEDRGGGQWTACCPGHLDTRPSLSVRETDDFTLLVYCHAGCYTDDLLAAIALTKAHLFPSDYARTMAIARGKRKEPKLNTSTAAPKEDEVFVPYSVIEEMEGEARKYFTAGRESNRLHELASELSLPLQALEDFEVGLMMASKRTLWVFPERDGKGRIVGLLIRDTWTAGKYCQPRSRRGLILATRNPSAATSTPLYITEGHTDTIAVHGAGGLAIGRAAASLSRAAESWLVEYLLAHPGLWQSRPVVVTGDNDPAGQKGAEETAEKLAEALQKEVMVAFPPSPFNDMREWINTGSFQPGWPLL